MRSRIVKDNNGIYYTKTFGPGSHHHWCWSIGVYSAYGDNDLGKVFGYMQYDGGRYIGFSLFSPASWGSGDE